MYIIIKSKDFFGSILFVPNRFIANSVKVYAYLVTEKLIFFALKKIYLFLFNFYFTAFILLDIVFTYYQTGVLKNEARKHTVDSW